MSFGIGSSDRRRHIYILGKTGMGKSTLLENMIIDDIRKGRGVAVIDPHGDLAESVIGFIPKNRTNQTIIFDPSDTHWPISFNMLEDISPEHRPLVASGLIGIFKKIFGDSWGPRLEHILRNTILALLEAPNSNLISIPLMLTSDLFRQKIVARVKDPVVKKFWITEFEKMAPNQKVEATGPILNKVGQFLSSSILRNVLGQSKNTFSIRWAMDKQRIIIINLSKGKIGEDASSLLGAMMVTKFQLDAMSRADIAETERKDFYLYVDEFQNFATDSFATILSEARKYKLNLVMANQYIDQMQESVRGAVFGNVGSIVSFQVGFHDANILKEVLSGEISEEDLMNLKKYNIYIKQLIDGMPSPVFSAGTFPPNKKDEEEFALRYQNILKVSREKYSLSRKIVEERINKTINDVMTQEKIHEKKKEEFKQREKERKEKERQKKLEEKHKEK
ncbi:type IV secretion system DNA-binding domain-containing protein [Candidatus Gracilibacteria bacterium]|nr:type IV secretion system DNA-binding domain-containing protein [Candidatus Gracilibacteria bacterium]